MKTYLRKMLLPFLLIPFVTVESPGRDVPAENVVREKIVHPDHAMNIWVYYPQSGFADKIPLIIIPPAGTSLFHGIQLSDGDANEHIPYVQAGFGVLSFDISGPVPDEAGEEESLAAARLFQERKAGIDDAQDALALVLARFDRFDEEKIVVAGHSSAGTLALSIAQFTPAVKACIAFAPVVNVTRFLGENMEFFEYYIPGFQDFIESTSPHNNLEKLKAPVFIFNALDDNVVTADQIAQSIEQMKENGVDYTHKTTDSGGHYYSMMEIGMPAAIAWLQQLNFE